MALSGAISEQKSAQDQAYLEAKRELYRQTFRTCIKNIMAALATGNHAEVWEIICDGPDPAGVFQRVDGVANVRLKGEDRGYMSRMLEDRAVQNGWIKPKQLHTVNAVMGSIGQRKAVKAVKSTGREIGYDEEF